MNSTSSECQTLPLAGVKVVEVAQGVSGPSCGRILASLGADVVKVEPPESGDWSRKVGPFLCSENTLESSALYLYNNTGKKSVTLDWKTQSGFNQLAALVAKSDILIEDWELHFRKSIVFDLDIFTEENPDLIELSVTPFGLSGPYANFQSSPIVQLALGGFLNLIGTQDREPLMLPGRQPDYLTGINAANAIQMALWDRELEKSGGRFLELSTMETLANLHQAPLDMDGGIRQRSGHRQSALSSKGFPPGVCTLKASDGYVTFGGGSPAIWEQLCLMLNRMDLSLDTDSKNVFENPKLEIVVDKIMEEWMSNKTKREVFHEASAVWMLPVAPVLQINEIMEDQHFVSRDTFQKIDHPIAGKASYPKPSFVQDNSRLNLQRPPLLGEHNEEYL
jgi:crotonobetainyl-CoA:carnitine CoA-transferase CaiB-like acyl-CoA transferase